MNAQFFKNSLLLASAATIAFAVLLGPANRAMASETGQQDVVVSPHDGNPFELLFFDATWNGFEVILHWDAINELELVGFQIERANGNGDFKRVGWVYCRELSREVFYEFIDPDITPGEGTYFYRLKMVNFDGSISYSPVTRAMRVVQ